MRGQGDGMGWRKSSYSGTAGANCVEVRFTGTGVHVRDSKNRPGPIVHFGPAAWRGFLDSGQSR
ncbi:DUF397 domain-containing protein [Actinocrispum wychmicini]|uniref:Uncharacterized protein DUF397 n=1 Tax=Actinocrispum wychmicini TaxID=1213861 RepID=A0A4R2JDT3_9PSEU|nr:DUF397 domain-containing protein [Actinocrispum wychmicini]TCO52425.1 uncharacterized protein DUF397 [Actinocrispum wychmicini]